MITLAFKPKLVYLAFYSYLKGICLLLFLKKYETPNQDFGYNSYGPKSRLWLYNPTNLSFNPFKIKNTQKNNIKTHGMPILISFNIMMAVILKVFFT